MYAVFSGDRISIPSGSVLRMPGSWQDFCQLRDRRDYNHKEIPRLRYRHGEILLMIPLLRQREDTEIIAHIFDDLLCYDEERECAKFALMTMELPEVGSIEPDCCFYIDKWHMGSVPIWKVDLPPDLAIEIDVTGFTSELDFLPFSVPEVWIFKQYQLTIYQLVTDRYEVSETSRYFPGVSLQPIIDDRFARDRSFRESIRDFSI